LQAFRSGGRFTGDGALVLAWLYGIATNLARMDHCNRGAAAAALCSSRVRLSAYEPAIAVEDRLGPAVSSVVLNATVTWEPDFA
jgi:DNA-directed RNA polymerase specialized sigma24 family protein